MMEVKKWGMTLSSHETIIKAEHLVKRYGDFYAVNGVDFEVHRGEVFGLLGPNGAGRRPRLKCWLVFENQTRERRGSGIRHSERPGTH